MQKAYAPSNETTETAAATPQPRTDAEHREFIFGNAGPLGLCAFSLTTFVMGAINCGGDGVHNSNVLVGVGAFYGGIVQLLAGMWEMVNNHTFNACAYSSFGGFWMSYAAMYIPWFNVRQSYETEAEFSHAMGFFNLGWAIFSLGLFALTFKSTVIFCCLFLSLTCTNILGAVAAFTMSPSVKVAGGVFAIITACLGWYLAFAGLANQTNSYVVVRPLPLPVYKKHL